MRLSMIVSDSVRDGHANRVGIDPAPALVRDISTSCLDREATGAHLRHCRPRRALGERHSRR